MPATAPDLPPALREALASPPLDRRPWQRGIAPAYVGLFSLIVYYDQLAVATLPLAGVIPALLGAAVAGLLCFGLLYYAPAIWGMRTGRPLSVVATSTFGASGAPWIPGVLIGLAHVIWFAVSIAYAADLGLRALASVRLLNPAGPAPEWWFDWRQAQPLFLFVTLVWVLSAATLGLLLMRVVAAVMRGFVVFPVLALVLILIYAIPGIGHHPVDGLDEVTGRHFRDGRLPAFVMMIQLTFGFFATFGASAADWGAASRDARDVRLGGFLGVALAGFLFAAIPLLIVSGIEGRDSAAHPFSWTTLDDFSMYSFRGAVRRAVGGRLGCATLLTFGLPLLGPICYSASLFSQRFAAVGPRLPRWAWSILGSLLGWAVVASGLAFRLDLIVGLLGAAMAPVVGALSADYLRNRGAWPGPRRGVNWAGFLAWAIGLAVGLVPLIGRAVGRADWTWFQPASLFAFATAFVAYVLLARLGFEPSPIPLPTPVDSADATS